MLLPIAPLLSLLIFSLHVWASPNVHHGHGGHRGIRPHHHYGGRQVQTLNSTGLNSTTKPSKFWYETITHNGQAAFMDPSYKPSYKVFRNVVTDFHADNTGQTDASTAIQNAITAGAATGGPGRNTDELGTTTRPAIVYLPAGTYLLKNSLQLYLGTVLMGDATNPPVLKASSGFPTAFMVYGKDQNYGGTNNFYIGLKNVVIDSTDVDAGQTLTLLDWSVSQATQLTNVLFEMPDHSTGHVGLSTFSDSNSNLILNDLRFQGGRIGLHLSGQQWIFKNLTFSGTTTGVVANGYDLVFLGCRWENGHVGINAESISGSLTVIDSSGANLSSLIKSGDSSSAANSIILDNVLNGGATVTLDEKVVVTGDVPETWVHGDLYYPGHAIGNHVNSETVPTKRSPSLLASDNKYFTMSPPTYAEYPVEQFINIKSVPGYPVQGDGVTDDTANINTILTKYAGSKIIYFPAGIYIVTDTVFVPAGSRIVGDAYASAISASGDKFKNANEPRAMVKVGNMGDVGVAQISDMLFTVSDVLEGCKLLEINISNPPTTPGSVGIWNSHFRIGGAKDTKIESHCTTHNPADCKAAWALLHLTATSSTYIENMWGWTADHDLDGDNDQRISTARGALIESTKGTWLIGSAMEHNTLYQYNFNNASNVFTALQQSETPYWQGPGTENPQRNAPEPWSSSLIPSDPDFSNCVLGRSKCHMAWFEQIKDSTNLFLYGGGVWAFFNDNQDCRHGWCQDNAITVDNSEGVYLYGTNTHNITNMVVQEGVVVASADANAGGWGGVVAGMVF